MTKSNLTRFGPTLRLLTEVVQVAGCFRSATSIYRIRLSRGVRLPRELQVKLREECLSGDFLLDEGAVRAGRRLAHPIQLCQTGFIAELQPRSAYRGHERSIAGDGKPGGKEPLQRFHAPDYGEETYPLAPRYANNTSGTEHQADKLSRRQDKCGTRIGR